MLDGELCDLAPLRLAHLTEFTGAAAAEDDVGAAGNDEVEHVAHAGTIELALRDGGDFDTAAVAALEAEYRYLKLQLGDWLERTA